MGEPAAATGSGSLRHCQPFCLGPWLCLWHLCRTPPLRPSPLAAAASDEQLLFEKSNILYSSGFKKCWRRFFICQNLELAGRSCTPAGSNHCCPRRWGCHPHLSTVGSSLSLSASSGLVVGCCHTGMCPLGSLLSRPHQDSSTCPHTVMGLGGSCCCLQPRLGSVSRHHQCSSQGIQLSCAQTSFFISESIMLLKIRYFVSVGWFLSYPMCWLSWCWSLIHLRPSSSSCPPRSRKFGWLVHI